MNAYHDKNLNEALKHNSFSVSYNAELYIIIIIIIIMAKNNW